MANTKSVSLNGTNQYLSILNSSLASGFPGKDHTGDFTYEEWIYVDALPSVIAANKAICGKGDISSTATRSFDATILSVTFPDSIRVSYTNGSASTFSTSTNPILTAPDVGSWVHIAFSVDVSLGTTGGGIKIYKNGSSVAVTDNVKNANSVVNTTGPFSIGARLSSSTPIEFFDGLRDEARMWNIIRTASQINDNKSLDTPSPTTGFEGSWRYEDDLTDDSGNGNTLTGNGDTITYNASVPFSGTSITLTDFTNLSGYQRDVSDEAIITIEGDVTGSSSVSARVVDDGTSNEVVGWTEIDSSPTSIFSGTLTVPAGAGWYNVQVRNNSLDVSNGTNKWGVGDFCAFIGQSNKWRPFTTVDTPPSLNVGVSMYSSGWNTPTPDRTVGWTALTGNGAITFANKLNDELGVAIFLLDYGIGAAALLQAADFGNGYWLNTTGGSIYDDFKQGVNTATNGNNVIARIMWGQGEAEQVTSTGVTYAQYLAAQTDFFTNQVRSDFTAPSGTLKVYVGLLGRNLGGNTTDVDADEIVRAQKDFIISDSSAYLSSFPYDLAMVDNNHFTAASYETIYEREAQSVLTVEGVSGFDYYRGQQIDNYTKVSSKIFDIHLNTTAGITDFTGESGFSILDDAALETILSVVRIDANTIRLTIVGTITGTPTVRYLFGANPDVSNPILGNDALTLPLESNADITELVAQTDNAIFQSMNF